MKLYTITNSKCLQIQAGIQGLHSTVELMLKYNVHANTPAPAKRIVYDWASNVKTVAVVNGGSHNQLVDFLSLLNQQHTIPFAEFKEEDLNDAITSISVVCTEEQVQNMAFIRSGYLNNLEGFYPEAEALILYKIATMRTM